MIELLAGDGFRKAVKDLGLVAKRTYFGGHYEVWALEEDSYDKIKNYPDEEWKEEWGWWRFAVGSNIESDNTCTFLVNNQNMKAYYPDHWLKVWECDDEEPLSTKEYIKEYGSFPTLTDYISEVYGASMEKNVCAISVSIANLNHMTMGALFNKYQQGK